MGTPIYQNDEQAKSLEDLEAQETSVEPANAPESDEYVAPATEEE